MRTSGLRADKDIVLLCSADNPLLDNDAVLRA